jgi:hypothetical protein
LSTQSTDRKYTFFSLFQLPSSFHFLFPTQERVIYASSDCFRASEQGRVDNTIS